MFRFLSISLLLLLIEKLDVVRQWSTLVLQVLGWAYLNYSSGLLATVGLIAIPLVISMMIDWRLIFRMFLARRKNKNEVRWETFVLLNWVCSSIFTLSMTHLLSYGGLKNIRQRVLTHELKFDNRLALILAFLSVTYLVGFFGVSLASVDVSTSSSRTQGPNHSLTSFVPPVYYLGIVAFVWQIDTSLLVRSLVCGTSMMFFAALHFSRARNASSSVSTSFSMETKKPDASVTTKSDDTSKFGTGEGMYTSYSSGSLHATKWRRQLAYDFFVYSLPLFVLGLCIPAMRPMIHGVTILLTSFVPIYDAISAYIYFQPSGPEDADTASDRLASYPHAGTFVNGWFRLADSGDLAPGDVKYVKAVGRHFALFRGSDGVVRCIDAHCIHLGANLAVGGRVVDNCLECPFHKWQFDGSGNCTHIPYQKAIPAQAKTRAYHVCEYYGIILVWHHTLDHAPTYKPPVLPKFERGDMVFRGRRDTAVNMHLNEFAENSTDFMHFDPLHGKMLLPFTPLVMPGITVNHAPGWQEGTGDEGHICRFLDNADLSFCGDKIPNTAASAVITMIGPASIVFFTFETPVGTIVLFQTHTPSNHLRLETTFRWYADAEMPRMLVWYVVGSWIAQWRNDIMVWENKKFAGKPLLVRGDGPMQKQRRWFKQFYTPKPTTEGDGTLSIEHCASACAAGPTCQSSSASSTSCSE